MIVMSHEQYREAEQCGSIKIHVARYQMGFVPLKNTVVIGVGIHDEYGISGLGA